ncbi:MAG: iron-containing alcohol dehydrogenase [Planctomycetes bacterium]|nr:iron-containing alcohol dehydrogenase [Planctomycetota bacterium]
MARRLEGLLGTRFTCTCGATHRVETLEVHLDPAAAALLAGSASRRAGRGSFPVVLDPHTRRAAGGAVLAALAREGLRAHEIEIEPARADEEVLARVEGAIPAGARGIISVGSGSVTDVTKLAASRARIPCFAFATAASMNGYTSAIAALKTEGVKRTIPCTPPVAVVADPAVLGSAPPAMARAGFGDLLARLAAGADWMVGTKLAGDPFCPYPGEIVAEIEPEVRARAEAIGRGDPEAVTALLEGLILSGIGMAVIGSSAPASGGEHLISHYFDMDIPAARGDRKPAGVRALHGAQTGVTTILSSALYRTLCAIPGARLAARVRAMRDPWDEPSLRRHFGALAGAVLPEAQKKRLDAAARERLAARIEAEWDPLRRAIPGMLPEPAAIRGDLLRAGAPSTAPELGIPEWEVREAWAWARWIRGRFTVLDLAAEAGVLAEEGDGALAASGILAAPSAAAD